MGVKKIHSLDHRDLVSYFINSRIIGRLDADDEIIIMKLRQLTQNLGKGLRTYLGRSAGSFA